MKRIPRPLAVSVLALAVAGLTGCSWLSEQTTALEYTPAEGSQVDLEAGVGVRNALFVSSGEDAPGTLVATVVNSGTEDATVRIEGEAVQGTVDVPAGESVRIGPDEDQQIVADTMGARPGELVSLQVTSGETRVELPVPVLDGSSAELADLVPTATASPSATS